MIASYAGIAPRGDLVLLRRLGEHFAGRSFLHVNSTKRGGGVAEILQRALPLMQSLGIAARWETIAGDALFFETTKKIHNGLQGRNETITPAMWRHYEEVNGKNAQQLDLEADAVLIHDPQPAPLISRRNGSIWMWRCHIDVANPQHEVWERLLGYCTRYDAAIFSDECFVRTMDIDSFVIYPSIDPLSEKNRELTQAEVVEVLERLAIPPDRPMILQVSRFDRFKDPLGVIRAYRAVKKYTDCVLVLAGSPADDDPEGAAVLAEVQDFAAADADVHILQLPAGSHHEINALQRAATVVLQKSLKEGFGLTVAEAMWKGKPVVAGATGGIPTQVLQGITGFLVYSEEGAAFRIRQYLNNPEMAARMGQTGREYVRKNFLITRQVRDYLTLWYAMENRGKAVLEI